MAAADKSMGQIPVIDISGPPDTEVAKTLVNAAAMYGFIYVRSHGKDIPTEIIDNMFELV